MNVLKKRILPVVAGLLTGWTVIWILEAVNHQIYPPPTGLDYTDMEAITAFMESLPTGAFVLLLAAWMIGAFAGGTVGALVNKLAWRNTAIIVGVIMALGSIVNMTMIPHPTWLMVVASIGYVPMAYAGAKIISKKK